MAETKDTKEREEFSSEDVKEEEAPKEPEAEAAQDEEEADAPTEETEAAGEEPGEDAAEEASEDAPEDGAAKAETKEKKRFGKKKDKRDEQIADLTDRVKRQLAEFENFRTRSEKEKAQMYDMGAKTIVEKILPVVDNFERGLADAAEGDPFVDGMKMVYKQLMTSLEEAGVKPIEALGEEFNPDYHNAVMQVESEEYDSGHIAQELQKGYMYRDVVVRHSMVAVVQ